MSAPVRSLLDATQVLPYAFDDATGKLRVDATINASGSEITVSDVDDSIKIGNGSSVFATITTVSGKNGIDVNLINTDIAVTQSGVWSTGRTWTLSSGTDSVSSVQSGTWNLNDISGTISLPTGASTSALQTTGNSSLSSIDSKLATLGQKLMTGSVPVVIASDQSSIPVTQSGTWNINDVSGTISLPTGAATSALQTTGNSSLASIDGKLNSLGQKTSANSVPITIASDQSTLNISVTNATLGVTQSTSPWVSNISQFGGSNVVTGTGTSGSGIPRVTVANDSNILTTQSGSWTVTSNQGTANSVGNAWPIKNTDGTDTQGVTTNGDAKVVDGLRNGGVYGALNIPTLNTPVEAKVGGSRLSQRKYLIITMENNGVFWGLDNTVTTTSGVPTLNGQVLTFSIDPDSTFQVWLVGNTNNKNVHIVEIP